MYILIGVFVLLQTIIVVLVRLLRATYVTHSTHKTLYNVLMYNRFSIPLSFACIQASMHRRFVPTTLHPTVVTDVHVPFKKVWLR